MRRVRKAIFPVGGLGTRFLPATKAMPKEMLPVVDKPLIQYAVEEARAAGIEELIFVTGRGKTTIEDHFDHSYELENTLERAVLMCDGQVIHGHHLPPSLQTAEASGTVTRVSLADAVAGFEKDLIQDALKTTRGNRAKAARLLDTTERVLNYKVKKYGVDVRRFTS